jgi:hypothetical protein
MRADAAPHREFLNIAPEPVYQSHPTVEVLNTADELVEQLAPARGARIGPQQVRYQGPRAN